MSDQNSFDSEEAYADESLGTLRFSRTQSYFDKSLAIRCLIALVFGFFLFLFLHFRETYVETLELGSLAKHYMVAEVDFAFPDEEATIILKQELGREIGLIFRVSPEEVQHRITDFQKFITQSDKGSEQWNEAAKESGFEDLALALSLLSDGLLQTRFTDVKTVQRIENIQSEELPIPASHFFAFLPLEESMEAKLPSQFWNTFGKHIFSDQTIPTSIKDFILRYFQAYSWKFEIDQGTEYTLRKLVQTQIPEKYTPVNAGERIIDRGEKVTSRHVAMLQAMKEKLAQKRNLRDPVTIVGSLLMTVLFLFVTAVYLKENHLPIFLSNRKLGLLATTFLLNILLAKIVELFLLHHSSQLLDLVRFPLFVPFTAILLCSLMNSRIAAFGTIFLALVFAVALAVETTSFLVINILTGMVAILSTRLIRRRKEVFFVCGKAWIATIFVILAFDLYENSAMDISFFGDVGSTFLFMMLTAVLVVGLLPILESIFQIMTDITLMEFMDPNNELLRRLTIEAPGTYQHSMVVGNLAETAASAIHANGLFCRVATQYHDIGKLASPQFFTENQMGGIDMHQLLTPLESAQVIIAHVREGVTLARKVGLPEQFIDIIKEHHGTTLVYYFYHKQIELMDGDKSKVNERDFRYSGPKPRTKESTIIMIADTFEAASRSLNVFNEDTITHLVESLIAQKMEDGQFDESLLTFEELEVVKQAMIKTLLAATHPRIKYPPHHPGEEG